MPAAPNATATRPTNRIEFTGVRYRGCSVVNQLGSKLSQPATIGMRVVAVNRMLELATERPVMSRMETAAAAPPMPVDPIAIVKTCGMGPIRLIWSIGTNASTALVPKMNITEMIGAAMIVATPDRTLRILRLTRQHRHVLEPAQRAHGQLAEDVEAEQRECRHRDGKGVIGRQRSARHVDEWQRNQHDERQQQHRAASVVQPLRHAEADDREDHQRAEHERVRHQDERPVAHHPGGARTNGVRKVRGDEQPERREEHDGEQPQIPRHQKRRQLAELDARPLIQAALERHSLREVDDHRRLRQVEQQHGGEPKHYL